ncbi:hypothetical protein EYF80_040447 [Liparis tanakae]|uniref:Uncharacterized protein n=1 Tax=Liparis tanakae TaxID=230148 RepID=A0A4Z2G709_9TELE|nr:hypothetical protein EYF80_040447 [Liparis tanakae]
MKQLLYPVLQQPVDQSLQQRQLRENKRSSRRQTRFTIQTGLSRLSGFTLGERQQKRRGIFPMRLVVLGGQVDLETR